jgi:hypothetical protein
MPSTSFGLAMKSQRVTELYHIPDARRRRQSKAMVLVARRPTEAGSGTSLEKL